MFEIYTLDNGLRVVTEYIEHVNSVVLELWFKMDQEMKKIKLMEFQIL